MLIMVLFVPFSPNSLHINQNSEQILRASLDFLHFREVCAKTSRLSDHTIVIAASSCSWCFASQVSSLPDLRTSSVCFLETKTYESFYHTSST